MDAKREAMLRRLQALDFYAYDLNLYLDTHPNNTEAMRLYRRTVDDAHDLRMEYEELYGPLTVMHAGKGDTWDWIDDPWPWERDGGMA